MRSTPTGERICLLSKLSTHVSLQAMEILFELFSHFRMLQSKFYCGFDEVKFVTSVKPFSFKLFSVNRSIVVKQNLKCVN
jgi:hypothetical protein